MFHIIQRSTIRGFVKMINLTGECVLELAGSLFLTHLALSLSFTFHKNSKGGRDDCCSVFVKSVARCQSRPRLRPCTRQLRLVLSRSLSPVQFLKPADLYTQQVLNGRAGCRTPNLKWPLKETLEFCIIYRKQTSNQYSLSSFDIVLDNSRYVWDCSSWKQLIIATGRAGRFQIWNLDCHKELENNKNIWDVIAPSRISKFDHKINWNIRSFRTNDER